MANNASDATSPVKEVLMDNHKSKGRAQTVRVHVPTSRLLSGKTRHRELLFTRSNKLLYIKRRKSGGNRQRNILLLSFLVILTRQMTDRLYTACPLNTYGFANLTRTNRFIELTLFNIRLSRAPLNDYFTEIQCEVSWNYFTYLRSIFLQFSYYVLNGSVMRWRDVDDLIDRAAGLITSSSTTRINYGILRDTTKHAIVSLRLSTNKEAIQRLEVTLTTSE